MAEQQSAIRLIPLDQIHPDSSQPRQLFPKDLAAMFAAGKSPSTMLGQLRARAEREAWIRERLRELDALADSIAADGLLQPIRVIQESVERFRIEQGERRWWAHHILVQRGDAKFRIVRAIVSEQATEKTGLLRRRVAENVLRSGFTAIELARAMSARIQEIMKTVAALTRRESEVMVGKENGMSDRRVRQFVALLTLAPEVQELAQQARMNENALRSLVGIKDTERQIATARALFHPSNSKARWRNKPKTNRRANSRKPSGHDDRKPRQPRVSVKIAHAKSKRLEGRTQRAKDGGHVHQLFSLAKAIQSRNTQKFQRDLLTQIVSNKADRRNLVYLRDLIDHGLQNTVQRDAGQNRKTVKSL